MDENQDPETNSLENPSTEESPASSSSVPKTNFSPAVDNNNSQAAPNPVAPKSFFGKIVQFIMTSVNIYMLLFILILVLAAALVFVGYQKAKKQETPTTVSTQTLDTAAQEQINGSDTKVGDPKQTLSIESNAVFAGKVLVRGNIDVAGTLKAGGATTLSSLTVSGSSDFDQINANKLALGGDATIQGQVSIQKTLAVSGSASFGGAITAPQLTIQTLVLNSDIQLNRHIDAGGSTPGQTLGTALGSGGTATVSGTDTAGTVTINTGSNTAAGCFITVNFAQKFNATPHVVITPVGSDAASMAYYVNRTSSNLSICTATAAPAGKSFAFDYIAID